MATTTFSGRQALVGVDIDNGVAFGDADQVESIEIRHEQELTSIYQLGDTDPQEIKEGTIEIAGTITRKFETGNFSSCGMTMFAAATESGVKTEFWIGLFPEGDAAPKILASNCKFSNWRLGVDIAGITTESIDFKAKALALT